METSTLLTFLALVALGSYIQTVSGFAIALIIMGGVTALGLTSVAFAANVVSFIAMANTVTALFRLHGHIDKAIFIYATVGVFLMSALGLYALGYMSVNSTGMLELLLGIFILISGSLLIMKPHPIKQVSSNGTHFFFGLLGGFLSGLTGAGGPALVIHLYRQPLEFLVTRTTLLAILGVMPLIRIAMETASGNITTDIIKLTLISVPVSIIFTIIGRKFPPPISETTMRRLAFALLALLGISLILSNL
jgi:uncharacterized protein